MGKMRVRERKTPESEKAGYWASPSATMRLWVCLHIELA